MRDEKTDMLPFIVSIAIFIVYMAFQLWLMVNSIH